MRSLALTLLGICAAGAISMVAALYRTLAAVGEMFA